MKVIKEMEHGILLNYFGLDNRFYLSVAVMTFFSFHNPDQALSEQELWPFVQKELGKETVFDTAMPKPKGEALLWGRCFAPEGKPVAASRVFFQLGAIQKTAYVFGNRHWKKTVLGATISDPEPFVEMPVTCDRAFGGKGFERNPAGKGVGPVVLPTGVEVYPLPNIEDPRHLIGSPGDRPEPAGFGPLDFTLPQRSKKLGTYDDKWLQEHWPFYPEDMDWTYFNAAPEDQQMEVFFNGDEKFTVANMHRTKPLIESRLPSLRHRVFINQLADKDKPKGEKVFREIRTHIDTVWLFPHAERGVVICRGTAAVADDEALDVQHLYVATEDPSAEPKTIEQFQAEFEKKLERKIPESEVAAMAAAKKKMAEAAERLKDLPQEMADNLAAALGRAPIPVRAPEETIASLSALIDRQIPVLDEGEKRFLEMKAKFGHMTKMDGRGFQMAREGFVQGKKDLQGVSAMIGKVTANVAAGRAEVKAAYRKALRGIDPALLKEKGIDPDMDFDIFKKTPEELWHERGMRFLDRCRDDLQSRPEYLRLLINTGLRAYTLKRAWIGVHPVPESDDPALWGLPGEGKSRKSPGELDIPSGIVVPCFDKARLHRIKISSFHHIYPPPDFPSLTFKTARKVVQDHFVEGSGEMAMVQGSDEGKPFVRVAYEMEALLLHQDAGAFCAVIAMKDPKVLPDKETAEFLKKAPQFLILQYPDSKEPADSNMDMWKALYPQAEPLYMPGGTNLFEARKLGFDLWQWVADALRPGVAPEPEMKPKEVDLSEPGSLAALIPTFDVRGSIRKIKDSIMARMKPNLDLMEKRNKEILDGVRKTLESRGLDADELMRPRAAPPAGGANPYASMAKTYARDFSSARQQLQKKGLLTEDMEKRISAAEKDCSDILAGAAALYDKGSAKLAAAKEKIAAGPPDWARELLAKVGIDPDDPMPLRRLTREEVMDRYGKGLSLAGKNLSGLDLSGLDLREANLSRANLSGTKMSKCGLDGADLTGVAGSEADFSHASMKSVRMTKGILRKAKFVETNLSGSDLSEALMTGADLSGANLTGAVLERTAFRDAVLKKANLTGARAGKASFSSTDASLADLSGADLTKASFVKSNIEETNFSGALMRAVSFLETKGTKANFAKADMSESSILQDSVMAQSAFTDILAHKVCWMKSDLSGSDFRGTVMKRGLIEDCDLSGSNLTGVSAKETRITKTNLSDAKMEKANLFMGSLRRSKLVRTDLRNANLYGVEFYRTGVGDTLLEGANLKMTKLHKRTDLLPEKKEKG